MTLAVRQIEIRGASGQPWLRTVVRRRVGAALAHVQTLPCSAEVTFFDDNGPKGGLGCRCAIAVQLPHHPTLRVERNATTPRLAFDAAAERIERQVDRIRERDRDNRRRPKKYFAAGRLTAEIAPPRPRRRITG